MNDIFKAAGILIKDKKLLVEKSQNKWSGTPKPSNEVEQIEWVTSANEKELQIGSIFEHEVIPRLKQQGLIN